MPRPRVRQFLQLGLPGTPASSAPARPQVVRTIFLASVIKQLIKWHFLRFGQTGNEASKPSPRTTSRWGVLVSPERLTHTCRDCFAGVSSPRLPTHLVSRLQVNDGQTWQEYLAASLDEPIRNYGASPDPGCSPACLACMLPDEMPSRRSFILPETLALFRRAIMY